MWLDHGVFPILGSFDLPSRWYDFTALQLNCIFWCSFCFSIPEDSFLHPRWFLLGNLTFWPLGCHNFFKLCPWRLYTRKSACYRHSFCRMCTCYKYLRLPLRSWSFHGNEWQTDKKDLLLCVNIYKVTMKDQILHLYWCLCPINLSKPNSCWWPSWACNWCRSFHPWKLKYP